MQEYVFGIVAFLIGAGLVGLVAYLVNSVKGEIHEIKTLLQGLVSKDVCDAHRSGMNKDINNLGELVRSRM